MTTVANPAQSDIGSLSDIVDTTHVTATDVLLALVAVVVAWVLARLARRGVRTALGRLEGINEDLRQLVARMTFYFLLLIGFAIALTFLGAQMQPVLTAVILLSVVAALALRGIADNFAAGVIIQTRRPIQIGDDIDVLDHSGIVREINGRSVIMEAWDGRRIHIPNSSVLANPLVNHTSHGSRRSEVEVRLPVSDPIDDLVSAAVSATAAADGVLGDPPPNVLVRSVDPQRVTLVVRFSHAPNAAAIVGSDVVLAIANAERARGRDLTVIAPPAVAPLTPQASM